MKLQIALILTVLSVSINLVFGQQTADALHVPHPLPQKLLVFPPADYRSWDVDTTEDNYLFYTANCPTYTYHVLTDQFTNYDSNAVIVVSCSNYNSLSSPTQELEVAHYLLSSLEWDSSIVVVPFDGSLKRQFHRHKGYPLHEPLLITQLGKRVVETTLSLIDGEYHYMLFGFTSELP